MNKYTVFFDQRNRTNYQVIAKDEVEAAHIGRKLYQKNIFIPNPDIQEGWIIPSDGEDK